MSLRRVLVAALLAIVAATTLVACGGSSAGAATMLEPSNNSGADPFTNSVAIGPAAGFPANVQAITATKRKTFENDPKTHTLAATGTAPGLYGGTGNAQVCNATQLVTFLQQNPAKGAAWASVHGIAPGDIAKYVASLTPVILTSDTVVTNHGYANGHATTLRSVLQAGTAVMVDNTGVPRVKCNCGNPLTAADPSPIGKTQGTAWPGYTVTQVVIVNAGAQTQQFTLVNVNTGDPYTQAAGSGGGNQQWVATEIANPSAANQTTIVVSADGRKWSSVTTLPNDQFGALAYGNGTWVAITTTMAGQNVGIDISADLKNWHRALTDQDTLTGVAYGAGRWVAVGGSIPPSPGGVVYTSTDAQHWTKTYTTPTVATSTSDRHFTGVGFGDNRFIAVQQDTTGTNGSISELTSTDGLQWSPWSTHSESGNTYAAGIAFGNGKWVRTNAGSPVSVSPDAKTWTPVPGSPPTPAIGFGNGTFMAVDNTHPHPEEDDDGPVVAQFSTSSNATTWSPAGQVNMQVTAIVYGAVPSNTSTTPITPPTTTAPVTTPAPTTPITSAPPAGNGTAAQSFDWKNYTYKDFFCDQGTVKFTDGFYHGSGVYANCGASLDAVNFGDVTGDGVVDAIVNISGSQGGTALGAATYTGVFTMGPSGPVNVGYLTGASYPPYSGAIATYTPTPGPSDPACCPSSFAKTTYTYSNASKSFVKGSTSTVPQSSVPRRAA